MEGGRERFAAGARIANWRGTGYSGGMRLRSVLTAALALLGGASCAGVPVAARGPADVVCRLQTRDQILTVYRAGTPNRWEVRAVALRAGDGRLIAVGDDFEQLRVVEPSLYRLYRGAYAAGSAAPLLLAD